MATMLTSFAAIVEARFGRREDTEGGAVGQYCGAKGHSDSEG